MGEGYFWVEFGEVVLDNGGLARTGSTNVEDTLSGTDVHVE